MWEIRRKSFSFRDDPSFRGKINSKMLATTNVISPKSAPNTQVVYLKVISHLVSSLTIEIGNVLKMDGFMGEHSPRSHM